MEKKAAHYTLHSTATDPIAIASWCSLRQQHPNPHQWGTAVHASRARHAAYAISTHTLAKSGATSVAWANLSWHDAAGKQ